MDNDTVRLSNATTGDTIHDFKAHLYETYSVVFCPHIQYLAFAANDAKLFAIGISEDALICQRELHLSERI